MASHGSVVPCMYHATFWSFLLLTVQGTHLQLDTWGVQRLQACTYVANATSILAAVEARIERVCFERSACSSCVLLPTLCRDVACMQAIPCPTLLVSP
jgi:hypothetical protein